MFKPDPFAKLKYFCIKYIVILHKLKLYSIYCIQIAQIKSLQYSLTDKLLAEDNLERENHKDGDDDGYTEYDHYGAPEAGTELFVAGFGGFRF